MLRPLNHMTTRPWGQPPAILHSHTAPACEEPQNPPRPTAKSKVQQTKIPTSKYSAELLLLTKYYRQFLETMHALMLQFMLEVRKKMHEAQARVLAECKAQEVTEKHRELMAWNQEETWRATGALDS